MCNSPLTLWDLHGIYVDMVREDLGYWNARVKGTANWTKVQVPLHLTRRVSSEGPLQHHQTFAWATVRVDWLPNFPKNWPSLHPDAFPRNSNSSPPPPWQAESVVRVLGWGSTQQSDFCSPEFLTMGSCSDKVIEDSLPRLSFFWKRIITYFILAESEIHPKGKGATWGSGFSVTHV
jgi:hypothetical protein